ncbi:MAG: exodeoxyribonuclease VII large subunit [Eubacterium sp.]|nr:exodeoxyribonuclease VII large subunit [Eubacterium sp.]
MKLQPLTVSELNAHIKGLLDGDLLLGSLAVRGELSNYKIYSSGHHYFTLKDAESSLKCVMFRSNASRIRFRPENGMGVTAVGSVSVYPRDGAYQLYCTELIPTGIGDLYLAFEQLKVRLSKEGLFDPSHKKPLPAYPKRIAVITSGSGAAVRDIIRVLGHRWPDTQVVILPVRVQGAEAPAEIVGAIRYANRHRVGDLIITGRGGGSMEDLWAFNDERVARAIYESELPVISAVGHEPDVTIADFVADLRAATPSNAAELAVPDQADVRDTLDALQSRLEHALRRQLTEDENRLKDLSGRKVLQTPTAYLDFKRMELDRLQGRIITVSEGWLNARRQQFGQTAAALDAMSPLKVLSRGYAVATNEKGRIIRSTSDTTNGEKLYLRVTDGSVSCRVESDEQ